MHNPPIEVPMLFIDRDQFVCLLRKIHKTEAKNTNKGHRNYYSGCLNRWHEENNCPTDASD